jgi:hypothetical protein
VAQAEATAGYTPGYHYLIRPDSYIALSSRADDPAAIIAWLRRLTSVPLQ